MDRVLSFLVITLSLIGQPLPHWHPESQVTGSGSHDSRPHVHLGSAGGHSHDEESSHLAESPVTGGRSPESVNRLPEHDADAIFFGDFRATGAVQKVFVPCCWIAVVFLSREPLIRTSNRAYYVLVSALPNGWDGTPLFLRPASLRI